MQTLVIATKSRVGEIAGDARMKLTDVIRRPLITEKTSILREDGRTLVFHVGAGANKIEIKRAIEQLLGSKVASIRRASRTERSSDKADLPDSGRIGRRPT
jgi:ribosomal protein L23